MPTILSILLDGVVRTREIEFFLFFQNDANNQFLTWDQFSKYGSAYFRL